MLVLILLTSVFKQLNHGVCINYYYLLIMIFLTMFIIILFTGLDEQGLYRVGGVSSKITKLLTMGLDRRKTTNGLNSLSFLDDCIEWETKTITSALKLFLRNLPEPLMTFKYHNAFILAASKIYKHISYYQGHS